MNRRVFDETLQSLKSSMLLTAATFFEERGLPFDQAHYEEQSSLKLDDMGREMIFFGANRFPANDMPPSDGCRAAA